MEVGEEKKMKSLSNIKNASAVLALGIGLLWGIPCYASFDWNNWEPPVGAVHKAEDSLSVQLNDAYERGYIGTNELAQFRRDLDGITTKEDQLRADHYGLSPKDERVIVAKLEEFQKNLDRATADKTDAIANVHIVSYTH
jgi:hypothetical protein